MNYSRPMRLEYRRDIESLIYTELINLNILHETATHSFRTCLALLRRPHILVVLELNFLVMSLLQQTIHTCHYTQQIGVMGACDKAVSRHPSIHSPSDGVSE